ncbi:MAG: DUF169 domain-containing protein [Deltaproteobacteria bacterium]|nr:DUF169 domain-containing protein [Deltaproteobacteria bacterium]
MDTSNPIEKAEFVYNNLRMKTLPVGVKFLKESSDLPEKARRPALFLKKRITMCQAMTMARIYGWQMGITKEDIICILASLAFGFTSAEAPRKEMAASFFESIYKSDMEKTVREVDQMCFLDRDEYQALLISPLQKIATEPDIILLYGNPAQISRMLQAATYDRGEKIQGLFGGKVECPEYLIRPLKTGEPRIIVPGPGDRIFSMTGDDEMILSMPYSFLDRFILGLKESGKKAGARYPITYYQNFQPEFPAHYQALGEKYGV